MADASIKTTVVLRSPNDVDFTWVVDRHRALYASEYGWDERFASIVAEVVAEFVAQHDPSRERAWIADLDGVRVGSVFLVRQSDEVAKLRLLLVEPAARGYGVGRLLVQQCIDFAKSARYSRITLWTNDVLHAARHLYERFGFQMVSSEPHHLFGEGLQSETWELPLADPKVQH